jgi:hypothetical protein
MDKVIEFLKSKEAKRFYWNTLNGAIGLAIIYCSGLNWIYAPVLIALLNGISKELNKRYF